jgi:threonine synthase
MGESPTFVCTGCEAVVAAADLRRAGFRCPNAGRGDVDHVLRASPVEAPAGADVGRQPEDLTAGESLEPNPFLRYRRRLTAWRLGVAAGLPDAEIVEIVQTLDAAVAAIEGRGFHVTPFERAARLSASLGFEAGGGVWVKDETGNVAGSHKGRHLMGVMLYLQVLERLEARIAAAPPAAPSAASPFLAPTPVQRAEGTAGVGAGGTAGDAAGTSRSGTARRDDRPRLAIASCGNAALAAAVVARAAGQALDVFVPPSAPRSVVERLDRLGARQIVCERAPGEAGDPCYLRFREAVAGGALGFCCQGPDNGLTVEGGQTLVWEMLDALAGGELDRLFVQVGGGALASACALALLEEGRAGRLSRLPRLHAVQTAGGFPLARAWARVALAALEETPAAGATGGLPEPRSGGAGPLPEAASPAIDLARVRAALAAYASARGDDESATRALAVDHLALASAASWLARPAFAAAAGEALRDARRHRSRVMWTWEREPRSIARGILDDETYDWAAVVEGMLHTGGWPIVVSDAVIEKANDLAVRTTGIPVDHTGSAGLAGLVALQAVAPGAVGSGERVAVIFSGLRRT